MWPKCRPKSSKVAQSRPTWFQGAPMGSKGLQGVPRSSKRFQGVPSGSKGFKLHGLPYGLHGLERPCLRAGPKGQPQERRRCGPEGPAPEAPRLPAEGRQASININSGASWDLFLILLGKSHIFSPKNLRFFSVKNF